MTREGVQEQGQQGVFSEPPEVGGLGGPWLRLAGLGPQGALDFWGLSAAPAGLAFLFPPSPPRSMAPAGGRHMVSELLNRKSGCRSSQISFHVVSLIPRAGFQKRFTVSVLQSYAPFNVGVFQEVGGEQLQSKHVCFTSASCGLRGPGRGGSNVASRLRGPGGCSRPASRGEPGAPLASPPLPTSMPASLSCPSLCGARPSQWGQGTQRPAPSHLVSPSG